MKTSEEERWPKKATWAKLKGIVSSTDFAKLETIFRQSSSDSHALAAAAQILYSAYRANGGYKLILELVSTHSASLIIIIWIRSSPDEYIILELLRQELTSRSQLQRVLMGYECWESHSPHGSMLLFPIQVVADGLSGYKTLESVEYAKLRSQVKDVARAAPNKAVSILTTEFNRLSREPVVALGMTSDLRGLGAKVRFMKHGSGEEAVKEYARHNSVYLAEIERIHADATHRDPLKGLRRALDQSHTDLQAEVNRLSVGIQGAFSVAGSKDRTWLEEAVSNGRSLRAESENYDETGATSKYYNTRTLKSSAETELLTDCFKHLLENPDDVASQAELFIRRTKGSYSKCDKKNVNLVFSRISKETWCKDVIKLGGMPVSANQIAKSLAYLQKMNLSSNDSIDAVLAVLSDRSCKSIIGDIAVVIEMIMREKLKSLTVTLTNRLSQYKGWVGFIHYLCEKRSVKFGMSACASGIEPLVAAQAEHDYHAAKDAAFATLRHNTSPENISTLDRELRVAALCEINEKGSCR